MLSLPPELRIANAAAVLHGPHGEVTQRANLLGLSRQALLRGVWRASSLVECINSVARMQQSRHRKVTQGLLDLKRLYWNCREFRTGHRRKKSPYDLHGLELPTREWWELLQLPPEQLRQQLQVGKKSAAESPPQKLSALEVAA